MDRRELEGMTREELISLAERVGVQRPRVLTLAELTDEILSRTARTDRDRARARGWLGRARDLLAGVVERGLHLPEVAQMLRTTSAPQGWPAAPPPLATLTLAEIYAAQGHLDRAIAVLDEVLGREPEHAEAGALRMKLVALQARARGASADAERPGADAGDAAAEASSVEAPTPRLDAVPASEAPTARAPSTAPPAETTLAADEPDEPATLRRKSPSSDAADEPPTLRRAAPATAVAPAPPPAAPPPDRYDVDEVVAIAVDPRTLYVYWEVRGATLARAQTRRPDGALVVRVVSVTPTWDGPVVRTRDLHLTAASGDDFVRDIEPGSSVRVSVGWAANEDFEPFAVGIELAAPHADPAAPVAHEAGRWSPEPTAAEIAQVSAATAPSGLAGSVQRDDAVPARLRQVALAELRTAVASAPRAPHAGVQASHAGPGPSAVREVLASPERLVLLEQWRVRRTGSSELVRELERAWQRERDVAFHGDAPVSEGPRAPGGSSDLGPGARGGASELGRRR
jgi:hypothetical protein